MAKALCLNVTLQIYIRIGCFICLNRDLDGFCLNQNLQDFRISKMKSKMTDNSDNPLIL